MYKDYSPWFPVLFHNGSIVETQVLVRSVWFTKRTLYDLAGTQSTSKRDFTAKNKTAENEFNLITFIKNKLNQTNTWHVHSVNSNDGRCLTDIKRPFRCREYSRPETVSWISVCSLSSVASRWILYNLTEILKQNLS